MSNKPNIKTNFLYNVAYECLAIAIPLVTAPYLSRVLGAVNIGIYSYTYSIAALFVMFGMLGVKNHGSRSIAAVRDNAQSLRSCFWSIYLVQVFASFVFLALYIVYALMLAENSMASLLWLPYIVSAMLDVNWYFFGMERFSLTVTRNFIVKLTTFALLFLVVRNSSDLIMYILLMSLSFLVTQLAVWPFLLRDVGRPCPSPQLARSNIRPILVLFVPVMAISIYTQLDKVLLGILSTMEQTGFFENSFKVVNLSLTAVTALGTVMLPRISNLVAQGRLDASMRYLSKSMWFVIVLSCALTAGLLGVAPVLAPVYFGAGFEPCAYIITVIALDLPFMAWANVIRTQYLIPAKRDNIYVMSVILGAIVNVCVNLVLIPAAGALGAACATVAAEITVCLFQTVAVRHNLPIKEWIQKNAVYFILAAVMAVLVRATGIFLGNTIICLLAEILVGAVSYAIMCIVYWIITKNEYAAEILSPVFKAKRKKAMKK